MSPSPRHLAVIPDGNRRWARARNLPSPEGHRAGMNAVMPFAEAAFGRGVECFTLWWGSPRNLLERESEEVEVIVASLGEWLLHSAPSFLSRWDARFSIFGRWEALCPSLGEGVTASRIASGSGPRHLVILMGYDGRDDLVQATQSLQSNRIPPTVSSLENALWTGSLPPCDLVFRSGGEPHISAGFLLWHLAEAELFFENDPWPACTPVHLERALAAFASRERRFGR